MNGFLIIWSYEGLLFGVYMDRQNQPTRPKSALLWQLQIEKLKNVI